MKTLLLIFCNLYAALIWAQTPDFKQYGWSTTNGGTTGGTGGAEVVVTTMADLNAKAKSSGKLIIYVSGTLTGRLSITSSDKTIFGLPGAKIQGSIGISGANNIIVRNLIVRGDKCSTYDECKNGDDAVGVSSGSKNIWLDHMDIADGQDGNCDVNRSSDFVTISWSKFSYTYAKQHRFSNLIGSSDAATYDRGFLSVTYHHCWWGDMVNERQPRVRFGKVHVANNLYTSTNSNYCARAGFESNMLVEGNVFKTTANSVDVEATATAVIARNNCGGTGANKTHNAGSAFKPPYTMPIEACGASLEAEIREWTGATLCDPRKPCGTVGVNTAPTVSITSPVTNSNYTSPATVLVKAKALDSDGTISKVEFFQGTTKIGEDLTGVSGEYTFSWTNVAAGSYTITAKATDDDGATKVSTGIVVNVKAPVLVAPKVALTSPLSGASDKSPATFAFAATASDADGTITKVEFWGRRGGTTTNVLLGSDATAPYTFNWQNITAEGDYFVFAKAIDDDGLETNTAVITITVLPKNVAPVVSITAPITNASYLAPADINLTVSATDSDGKITKVEYFNGTTKLGEDLVTPYSYSIIDLPVGTYTLTAKATDNDGAISTSTGIIVKVTAPVLVPPVVTLNTPTASQVFTTPASVSFTATATDKDGTISKVEFWGRKSGTSGVVLLGSDASSPYSYNWATSEIGGYLVYAKAFDNDGQMTNSTVVNITIKAPNVLPTIAITDPVANEVFDFGTDVDLVVNTSDADGTVEKVEFYRGTTLLSTDLSEPFNFTWAGLAAGSYTVTAKAYDNEGASKVSTAVTFKVNAAPKVTITTPANSTSIVAPADISISATATDADGTISKVEFFNGTTKLGEDVSSPYGYSIIDLAAGTYKIIAKALDNNGFYSEPDTVSIVVTAPALVPPTVTLLTPTNGQIVNSTALPVVFTATASDADGSITKVEFWGRKSGTSGVVLLGSDASSPYAFNWTPTEFGNYVVYAKAYDNDGLKTNSAVMSISIQSPNQAPTISFVKPLDGSVYSLVGTVDLTLEVNATDDGSIDKVEYYQNNVLIGQSTTSPYNYIWSRLSAGVYTLVAKAYDNQGAVTSSNPIKITVNDVLTGLVDDLKTNNNGLIAPNPFTDQLSFSLETSANIEVLDINGKTVFNGLVEKETINTSNWPNGIYFIKSSLDNKVLKFIKVQ